MHEYFNITTTILRNRSINYLQNLHLTIKMNQFLIHIFNYN